MLFNSLAQQTSKDFEVICVDELAPYRSAAVFDYAKQLGINLVDVVPSKPKVEEHKHTKFGIAKALNTGLLLSNGPIISIVMDFAWLPPKFVERTIEFYKDHPKSLLAYPEIFMASRAIETLFADHALSTPTLTSLFKEPMTSAPSSKPPPEGSETDAGWFPYFWRPKDVTERKPGFEQQAGGDLFWEMSFSTAPWSVFEALNGVDEWLDYGDDCHEVNIRLRSEMLGYDLWIDGQCIVEQVQHRTFKEDLTWTRSDKDANWGRHSERLNQIRQGSHPLAATNAFNLTKWRTTKCPRRIYSCPA